MSRSRRAVNAAAGWYDHVRRRYGLDGDVLMARVLMLDEMVDYVASDAGGGAWNYRVSISAYMTAGTDLTAAAQKALRLLPVK